MLVIYAYILTDNNLTAHMPIENPLAPQTLANKVDGNSIRIRIRIRIDGLSEAACKSI